MTNDNPQNPGRSFARSYLPWLLGAIVLALYLFTLDRWISSTNLSQVAWIGGHSWQTEVREPLYYAATFPLRFLPPSQIPLGLNLFSAVCATLSLILLARSVTLLPHDRTQDQRDREKSPDALLSGRLAWLPPTLAVVVCGLQLTFWQHATDATPDMVKLLLFAYVIRALLEFRFDDRDSWLYKAALAYGMLMTSDWIMFGLFPVFVAALIWMRGLSFFDLRFLGRMLLFGLLGLTLYFLLPIVAARSNIEPIGFWTALKLNILSEKDTFWQMRYLPKQMLLLLSLTSALPVIVMSIRWASYFGDTSQLGVGLTKLAFHVVHLIFLGVCLWVMLDPRFSPRSVFPGLSFLNLYYLSALSVGYFSGYFLVAFRPLPVRRRRPSKLPVLLYRAAVLMVVVLALVVPAILVIRNFPIIRGPNRNAVTDLARLTVESLPKSGSLLSDDPRRVLIVRAWLARAGRAKDFLIIETGALKYPAYHRYLKQEYGDKWPITADFKRKQHFSNGDILNMVRILHKAGDVIYLHPSFGYFFEQFHLEPHGLTYKLKPFKPDELLPPPLSAAVIKENNDFWDRTSQSELVPVLAATQPDPSPADQNWREKLFERLKLAEEPPTETRQIGEIYSRSLNYWGVAVQKSGDLEKAGPYFDLAVKLFPDNVIAKDNLSFNEKVRAGQPPPVQVLASVEDRFGRAVNWDDALQTFGPFEDPSLNYTHGRALVSTTLFRQAAQAFDRVLASAPDFVPARLWISKIYMSVGKPDKALQFTQEMLDRPEQFKLESTNRIDTIALQANALFQKDEPQRAENLLESAVQASPKDTYLLASVVSAYNQNQRYSNALINIDRQLKLAPEDSTIWLNKGYTLLQMTNCAAAIPALTRSMALETNTLSDIHARAQLNRALAYLRCDKIDDAKADFETLQQQLPNMYQIYYNLGEIALRQNDTNLAIQHYQSYLSNAIPDLPETIAIQNRLKELKGGKPEKP